MGRWVLLGLALVVVAIQVIRPEHTNPPTTGVVSPPPQVEALLRRACWDCHSHETVWPWYAAVAPASWLLAHDVREGREELDFSRWTNYRPGQRNKKLREIAETVRTGEMPPWYYVLLHTTARLDDGERERLASWADDESARR